MAATSIRVLLILCITSVATRLSAEKLFADWLDEIKSNRSLIKGREEKALKITAPYVVTHTCVVELIFKMCKDLEQPADTRYRTVELFDRFVANQFMDLVKTIRRKKDQQSEWNDHIPRISSQALLRVVSCIQLASKYCAYSSIVNPKTAHNYLNKRGQNYSIQSVLQSEIRVFKSLNYEIGVPTLLVFVDILLPLIREFVHDKIYTVCINIVDVVYLHRQQILRKLNDKMIANWRHSHLKKLSFSSYEFDGLYCGAACIVTAVEIFYPSDKHLITAIKEKMASLIDRPANTLDFEAENSPIELGLYFRKEPDDTIVVSDNEAILHCSAYTTLANGNLSFQWTRNNVNVTPSQRRQLLNNGSLIFTKIDNLKRKHNEPDDGEYRCAVTVDYESTKLTLVSKPAIVQTANLWATVPDGHAVNATSAVGGTARLKCEIRSIPAAKIKWTFQDKPLPPNDERYDTSVPGILYVSDTRPSDSGEYKCHATNSLLNTNRTIGFHLNVTDDARISNATTAAATAETIFVRREREPLLLDCYSESGDVNTSVVWTYKRAPEDRIKTVSVARRGYSVLKLEQFDVYDAGTYVCQHMSGSRHHDPIRTVLVNVTSPLAIAPSSDVVDARLALVTRLACQVSGAPAANVSWWHNGNPVKTNARVKATEKGLLITNINTADAGMYQCFAANEYGTVWTAARLRITDLANPSAPSDMECEPLSSRSIRVRWKPPKDDSTQPPITFTGKQKSGEQPTIAYSVFYHYADGTQNGDWSIPSADRTVVVSKLQPNRGYTFYVRAYGGKSGSNPSDEVTCVTFPLETESSSVEPASNAADDDNESIAEIKPRSKSILSAKLINKTTFEVSWRMDKPNGIIVDELYIECKKRGANDSITIPVNFEDKRAVLFNLDPQSEYDIRLMIVVNKTKATAAQISYNGKTFVTPKDGFEISATQISSRSANVTWTVPSQTTTAATKLDIVYSDEKSNQWVEMPINNRLRYVIIDDMRSDTWYTIMLRLNKWPDRKEAVASTRIQLSSSSPSAIIGNVSVHQSGPNSVRISWEAGATAPAEYVVNVYPSRHTNVVVKSNSVELADLKTNVEYKILVSAAAKTSEESATAAAFGAKPTVFTLRSPFEGEAAHVNDSRSIFAAYLNDDQMLGVYIGLAIGCVFVVSSVIGAIYCKRLVMYKRRGVANRSDVFAAAAGERNEMKYFPRNSNGHKLYSVESSAIREESDKLLTTIDSRGEDANLTTIRDRKDNNENEGGDSGYCDRHHSHSPHIGENGAAGRSEHKGRKCSDLAVDDGFSENEASHGASGTSSNDSTRFT